MSKNSFFMELNKVDKQKILKGAAIAGLGAALTFLSEHFSQMDLGGYNYIIIPLVSVAINTGLKYFSGEKRLQAMNEFRQALKDQNNTFLTRCEYDTKHLLIETKIELLQKLIYIGLGAILVIEILLKIAIK